VASRIAGPVGVAASTTAGPAFQLTTARRLGVFLRDPTQVPTVVLEYVVRQLEVEEPSCVGLAVECDLTSINGD
jgi:hypothetical protein